MYKNQLFKFVPIYFLSSFMFSGLTFADTKDYWTGKEYHKNSSSQKEAASDLIKQLSFTGLEHILDIGCGDGKITKELSEQLSKGSILGIDISSSMISFAEKTFSKENLQFKQMDANNIPFCNQFDTVVSFTAFQWVNDHALVIKNVKKSLKPYGTFAVTMPMGLPTALQEAVDNVLLDKKWNNFFTNFSTGWNFVKKEDYENLLNKEGFMTKKAQVVKQEDIFPSLQVFKGFISQWFPYLRVLPENLKEEFMDRVLSEYLTKEPLDNQERLHFKIDRLEVIAQKN